MNVFEFRENLVGEYAEFTRSFTRIRADDIRLYVDTEYASQRFWPEPLVARQLANLSVEWCI